MKHFVTLPYLLSMYSTSSGRGFLPLVTAAHEISPTCSCMRNPGEEECMIHIRGDDQHLFVSSLTLPRCMKVNSVVWKSLVTETGVRRIRRRMVVFPAAPLYDTTPVELIITFPFTVHCHKTIGLQERHFKLHPQEPQTN